MAEAPSEQYVTTDVPQRLDRLPWSRWHVMVVIALGVTWLLDGLEGNLAGSLADILKRPDTLHMTDALIGLTSTIYLFGAVVGALVFGYATDRLGRKKLFSFTLLCQGRRENIPMWRSKREPVGG
jgi:MFS family permease